MQKLIGSIMIILACTAIGFEKSQEMLRHLKELEELKKVMTLIRSEMQYTKVPFAEIFQKISKKTEGIYADWLTELAAELEKRGKGTFQEMWRNTIKEKFQESTLSKKELDELCHIGASLGYLETIDLYLEQLDYTIQNTKEETTSKKKLYQSMGVMGGVFLVIILL